MPDVDQENTMLDIACLGKDYGLLIFLVERGAFFIPEDGPGPREEIDKQADVEGIWGPTPSLPTHDQSSDGETTIGSRECLNVNFELLIGSYPVRRSSYLSTVEFSTWFCTHLGSSCESPCHAILETSAHEVMVGFSKCCAGERTEFHMYHFQGQAAARCS